MTDQGGAMKDTKEPRRPSAALTRYVPWLVLAVFLLFAYLTRGILLPFIVGFAVAYLLDPLVDQLESWGMGRGIAAGLVIGLGTVIGLCALVALWPLLQNQISGLIKALPGVIETVRAQIDMAMMDLKAEFGSDIGREAQSVLASALQQGLGSMKNLGGQLFAGGLAFFNLLALILIAPMAAFYLLRDYDKIIEQGNCLLPKAEAPTIRGIAREIDRVLSGFVRGQLSVMAAMAVLYSAGWSLVGLDYGLILGLLAGLLGIIPFLGMLFAAAIALIVGFGQWGPDWVQLGLVAGVWLVVQALEGAILTPRLLGHHVGLHPVWVLFAVFAGGEVAGFVGVMIAVPVAAVVSVLVRRTMAHYRKETEGESFEALSVEESSAVLENDVTVGEPS
ncbi:AI-2E family transporter [Iodidimonas gelatinilytica]|uniref:AI-2E family transporter n=1 Tax=Iodidimonas gelatinilytica TaxID=1236966 RepID=A0A5A7MM80_9PROT|nr:AI-2E family transporter [Iodidimonas gelatinilytica]GEQ96764.1 AI-2E family transporter [Iodidimonas gelatinilytica]